MNFDEPLVETLIQYDLSIVNWIKTNSLFLYKSVIKKPMTHILFISGLSPLILK